MWKREKKMMDSYSKLAGPLLKARTKDAGRREKECKRE